MIYRRPIQLDPTSRKTICPNCGKKRFVDYVYSDDKTPVASGTCGKCDRADHCGYHYPPKDYFRDHDFRRLSRRHPYLRQRVLRPTSLISESPTFIPKEIVFASMTNYHRNPLVSFLHTLFDSNAGQEIPGIVESTVTKYGVGTSTRYGGSTVFWQHDIYGNFRTGQIIGYDSDTGKRVKGQQNYVHSVLSDRFPDFQLRQCYFGSHLLRISDKERNAKNELRRELGITEEFEPAIWLFESPKAALIADIALTWGGMQGAYLPMATFGCAGLNPKAECFLDPYDKHQALRGRTVILFPDNGKYDEWKSKADQLRPYCQEVTISSVMEEWHRPTHTSAITPTTHTIEPGDGFDDLIIRHVQAHQPIWHLLTSF